jgi:hypothetical protein
MFTLIGGNAKNSVDAVYVELTNLLGYESPYVEYFNTADKEIYGGNTEDNYYHDSDTDNDYGSLREDLENVADSTEIVESFFPLLSG